MWKHRVTYADTGHTDHPDAAANDDDHPHYHAEYCPFDYAYHATLCGRYRRS